MAGIRVLIQTDQNLAHAGDENDESVQEVREVLEDLKETIEEDYSNVFVDGITVEVQYGVQGIVDPNRLTVAAQSHEAQTLAEAANENMEGESVNKDAASLLEERPQTAHPIPDEEQGPAEEHLENDGPGGGAEEEGSEGDKWTLKTSPEDYLERYPEGPHAEQARKLTQQ